MINDNKSFDIRVVYFVDAVVVHTKPTFIQHPFLEHAQSGRSHQPGSERSAHTLSGEFIHLLVSTQDRDASISPRITLKISGLRN